MARRSIVEFEQSLAKQIADERAVLAKLEADVVTSRIKIETLEAVQANLKSGTADDGKESA